jgi:pimeloyl-ACP methyl ester carboxylesterase
MRSVIPTRTPIAPGWQAGALVAAGLAASLLYVQAKQRSAERQHPPQGQFVDVDGVRLHYTEHGEGQPLVLLHGNGLFGADFDLTGLEGSAGQAYRVISIDRPGFGYSARPGHTRWTPEAQARLIYQALHQIGVERPIVAGHAWGTLVALAMALDYPRYVRAIALVSGHYYPGPRLDAALLAAPAIPGIGHLLRYTLAPLLGRLLWPRLARRMFAPAAVPERFAALPKWLALRPAQLGASAAEAAMLVPAARRLSQRYGKLTMPVALIAGAGDQIADVDHHAQRLHREVAHSELIVQEGIGHMPHYADPGRILDAIARMEASLAPGAPSRQPAAPLPASATLH